LPTIEATVPLPIFNECAIVEVAIPQVVVALNEPKVGTDVATTRLFASVERIEFIAGLVKVRVPVNLLFPEKVFASPSKVDDALVSDPVIVRFPPPTQRPAVEHDTPVPEQVMVPVAVVLRSPVDPIYPTP
jgi:hypothetical protein